VTARSTSPVSVPDRPRVIVVLHSDGGGTVNGRQIRISEHADARTVLMTEACRFAATLGRPVRVEAHDPDGVWDLVAHPDGSVTASGRGPGGRKVRRPVLQRRDRSAGAGNAPAPPTGGAVEDDAAADPAPRNDPADDDAVDDADDDSVDAGPARQVWYQAPRATTRPRPAEASDSGPGRTVAARSGPGLATTPGGRPAARPEPMVWSGRTPGRRPSASRSLFAGLVVGGLGIAALITFTVPGSSDRTEQQSSIASLAAGRPASGQPAAGPADVPPSGAPAPSPLDLAVPPGYRRTPVWAVDIASWTRSTATDDGTVLSRDPAGHVLLLDPVAGRTLWSSPETTTNDLTGPWPASIDGARVAIVSGPGRLTYWTLPSAGPSGAPAAGRSAVPGASPGGTAVTVPLPAGSVTSWAGPSPLVLLPNRTVAVIRSGVLVPVPLAAGARGLAADAEAVLAATATTWLRQPAGRPPVAARLIPRPAKAGAAPLRVEAVGSGLLLTIWPQAKGPGQVVALMDTTSGANVVQTEVTAAADLRTFGIVREVGGSQLALGPLLVDTYAAKVDVLDMRYVVKGLSRGHAWTMFNGKQATDLHLTSTGDFTAVLFGAGEPAVPVGVSRLSDGTSRAMVTAPSGDGWVLAGLAGA